MRTLILRRLLIVLTGLAFLVGAAVQAMPPAWAFRIPGPCFALQWTRSRFRRWPWKFTACDRTDLANGLIKKKPRTLQRKARAFCRWRNRTVREMIRDFVETTTCFGLPTGPGPPSAMSNSPTPRASSIRCIGQIMLRDWPKSDSSAGDLSIGGESRNRNCR
jgi:hypothetical protein